MALAIDFDDEFASVSQWVAMYRAAGLQVVPAVDPRNDPNFKRPVVAWKEFENDPIPEATIERWYGPQGEHARRRNLGLITGRASGGVFCVDLDVKEGSQADQWWAGLLAVHNNDCEPETPAQRTGGGGRQILFRAPDGWLPPTFKTPLGVDIRGQGGFMVAPPSMHSSGRIYDWTPGREPWNVDFADAPEWLIEAIEILKEEHGGTPTGPRERVVGDNETNAFGKKIEGREQDLRDMVWAAVVDLYRAAPIPPTQKEQDEEKRRLWLQYLTGHGSRLSVPGVEAGELLEREGRGWSELDRKWRYAMKKWSKEVKAAAGDPRPGMPPEGSVAAERLAREPEGAPAEPGAPEAPAAPPLLSSVFDPWQRYPVPPFPMDALPPKVAAFVRMTAKSTGGDLSAVAMSALVTCSGALSQEFRLKMKRSGTWYARPRLWALLIGDSSSKKTPIVTSCIAPLRHVEVETGAAYRRDLARWKALGKDTQEPEPLKPLRYVFNDITSEKVGDILSRQDRGALVEADEVSGWITNMDKYGKGSDRSFWLQAYNGGPKTVDRLGRGETFIQNLCVAFIGGIQPARLNELGALTADGLLQRFLPVMMGRSSFPEEVEDDFAQAGYENLIAYLSGRQPTTLRASEGALEVFEDFQRHIFALEKMQGLGEGFCSFVGKLTGVQGSLALTLQMMGGGDGYDELGQDAAFAATDILMKFVIPHALEFYSSTQGKGWSGLRSLASYVLTSDKERFTAADFTRDVHAMRGLSIWDLHKEVSPLVAGGWLIEDAKTVPAKAWHMVAGVRETLSKRRVEETEARSKVIDYFKNIRAKNTRSDSGND